MTTRLLLPVWPLLLLVISANAALAQQPAGSPSPDSAPAAPPADIAEPAESDPAPDPPATEVTDSNVSPPGGTPAISPGATESDESQGAEERNDGGEDPARISEQTIYVPYEKLNEVFEREGRGVFLPYDKFQELWNAARATRKPTEEPQDPLGAFINEIESEATIGDNVVNVEARLKIEVLSEGWNELPLRLSGSAIRSALLDSEPARVIFDAATGYKLLVKKEGKAPKKMELEIGYSKAFIKTPGQSRVSFQPPQAPVNRWKIRIDEPGVKIDIQPMVAATEGTEGETERNADESTVLAFVAAAPAVTISWNPKAEGASGLAAFATVQSEQQIVIDEGLFRTRTQLVYEISRSSISQLRIRVPLDQKVVNVFDRNVKKWEVQSEADSQVILVDLFEPESRTQALMIELEQFFEDKAQQQLSSPMVEALEVARQQGVIVVRLGKGLSAEAIDRTGLLQLDQNDLPASLKNTTWSFSYRYAALPYKLSLSVEKVLPRIVTSELIETQLTPNQLKLDWQIRYTIQRAGVFQFKLMIPDVYELDKITGFAAGGSNAAAVDTYHRLGESNNEWVVNLSRKAMGEIGLLVQLRRELSDPNLMTPTGESTEIAIPLPGVQEDEVEFSEGNVVISGPESLRINPVSLIGLRAVSFDQALSPISSRGANMPSVRPILAYAFSLGNAEIDLDVERRKPQVTVDQLLSAAVEAGVVKFDARFYYQVRYSGIKSVRIDVPQDLADEIRNQNTALRNVPIDPQPDNVPEGYVAWNIEGQSEFLGPFEVHLAWEEKMEELTVGKGYDISLPRLIPFAVDRSQGQIVAVKAESIDLQPTGTPTGLRPIDPQNDLKQGPAFPNAALAFEFVDDWSLTLQATRYDVEETKQTSIERAVVRMVALPTGEVSVQAIYRVRSSQQRLSIQMPAEAQFDSQPLQINGQPYTLERGMAGEIFVPLVGHAPDEALLVDLRFSVPGTPSELLLPEFPDEPAVQRVYLCTYLSPNLVLLGSRGDWNKTGDMPGSEDDEVWRDDDSLVQWVSQDIPVGAARLLSFQVGQNRRFVFSALRPAAGSEGALQLLTFDKTTFNILIFGLVAAIGLPFYGRSIPLQFAVLVMILIAAILIGVLAPTLANQIFGGVFATAMIVVVLAWSVGHCRALTKAWKDRTARESLTFVPTDPPASPVDGSIVDAQATNDDDAEEDSVGSRETVQDDGSIDFVSRPPDRSDDDPSPESGDDDQEDDEKGGADHA